MAANPEWQVYVQESVEAECLIRQENKILVPTPFIAVR